METFALAANTKPFISSFTVWEAKEWVGLLAIEPDEWREKRYAAEASNSTADVLTKLAGEVNTAWKRRNDAIQKTIPLLASAIAAHPNTPPHLFPDAMARSPFSCKAFCTNPIIPFLLLETPNFVADLTEQAQQALLREAAASPQFVQLLAAGNAAKNAAVRKAARLHVAFAGQEIPSQADGEQQLSDYWQAECEGPKNEFRKQWHADLAETGIAPLWAQGTAQVPLSEPLIPPFIYGPIDEWLTFSVRPDSLEEAELFRKFGPNVQDSAILARGLRKTATPDDLVDLIRAPASGYAAIAYAVSRHPSVNADVLRAIAGSDAAPKHEQMLAYHTLTPPDVVTRLLQSRNAEVRRLARSHPNAPPNALAISRQFLSDFDYDAFQRSDPFLSFVECMRATQKQIPLPQTDLLPKVPHVYWTQRLEAALLADVSDEPIPDDFAQRTGCDLLNHLTHDGNRFVRWAAQTRLADPDYIFTWHGESNTR